MRDDEAYPPMPIGTRNLSEEEMKEFIEWLERDSCSRCGFSPVNDENENYCDNCLKEKGWKT